jgi:hypothetical protein
VVQFSLEKNKRKMLLFSGLSEFLFWIFVISEKVRHGLVTRAPLNTEQRGFVGLFRQLECLSRSLRKLSIKASF